MKITTYQILPSTNTKAKEMILAGAREGVILAEKQTAGRGRLGRSFFSENGLFMSIILAPDQIGLPAELLTSATAAAVCRVLRQRGFDVGIKWVNDLYFEGKKACGILTEAVSSGNTVLGYIVGIGLNLGVSDFPEELADIATAIPIPCEKREELLREIVAELQHTLSDSSDALLSYLRQNSLVLGKPIRFFGPKTGEGIAFDLDANGGLIVEIAPNEQITLTTGEISVRFKNS